MSGFRVPYHLRTNKFVERQIFMDLIDFVRVWNGPREYVYASMGGQFLEDFKAIHDRYGIDRLISFEMNEVTWKRQKFNSPLGCVECVLKTSGEFIEEYFELVEQKENSQAIIWLDYAAANDRGDQLQEFEALVEKLVSGDLIKITLNCNPQSKVQRRNCTTVRDFEIKAIAALRKQLDPNYSPAEGINAKDLKPKQFANLLAKAVKNAALRGLSDADDFQAIPLGSYRYSDGEHQMLTVTMLVANEELVEKMDCDKTFGNWPMRSNQWEHVHEINVPDLSQKERAFVNERIGRLKPHEIHGELPFWLEQSEPKSQELLRNYVVQYRRYPAFGRIFM